MGDKSGSDPLCLDTVGAWRTTEAWGLASSQDPTEACLHPQIPERKKKKECILSISEGILGEERKK